VPSREARLGKRAARPATGQHSKAIAGVSAPSLTAIASTIIASAPSSAPNTHSSGRAKRAALRWIPANSARPAPAGSRPSGSRANGSEAAITTISASRIVRLQPSRRAWRSMTRARSNWLRQIQESRGSASGRILASSARTGPSRSAGRSAAPELERAGIDAEAQAARLARAVVDDVAAVAGLLVALAREAAQCPALGEPPVDRGVVAAGRLGDLLERNSPAIVA
jgi:hypothetical protein